MLIEKPKFVYVARKPCGCVVGIASDYADKDTAKFVAEFIKSGLSINRHSFDNYRNIISKEAGFMNCQHDDTQDGQLSLFMSAA